jgi:hypothetical protein
VSKEQMTKFWFQGILRIKVVFLKPRLLVVDIICYY